MRIASYFKSLRGKVVLLSAVSVFVGLLLLSASNIWTAEKYGLQALNDQTRALAAAHVETLSAWLNARKTLVQSLAAVANLPEPAPYLKLATAAGHVTATYIGYADKHEVDDEPWNPPAGYDPTSRPWYLAGSQTNTPVVTEPYVDVVTKKLVVTFANGIRADGKLAAVAAADVSMEDVIDNVATIHPTPSSFAFLASASGKILVHARADLALKPVSDLATELNSEGFKRLLADGRLQDFTLDGKSHLLLAQAIPQSDWVMVIALDRSEAMAGVDALVRQSVVVTALIAAVAAVAVGGLLSKVLQRLHVLRDAMADVGSDHGNLTLRLSEAGTDELADIGRHFNQFVHKIQEVLIQVSVGSDKVAQASADIAHSNHQLSGRTARQSSALLETNFALDGLRGVITENGARSSSAQQMATQATADAQGGGQVVGQVVATMDGINKSSKEIETIIGTIDAIAFQTNILALNAAVEAARAGEQGRGFAVVASEVRALAGRAAGAAKEIKELIDDSVRRTGDGTQLVNVAGASISTLVGVIERVHSQVTEISSSATQQLAGLDEVAGAMDQLDRTTKENAAMVDEVANAGKELSAQASALLALVGRFQLS